ncbi:hypothetical protein NCPPB940_18570 [Xanthomonas hortorum pv. taraxaci]|nr:hypothetical protein NCPPB940_18570 [Xanthomonas hortorum pv. taraxaci]CAD0325105.1 hypothetical protein NCPPB940_18570 [Xanthomonas hortorum pv. taraxaci]
MNCSKEREDGRFLLICKKTRANQVVTSKSVIPQLPRSVVVTHSLALIFWGAAQCLDRKDENVIRKLRCFQC